MATSAPVGPSSWVVLGLGIVAHRWGREWGLDSWGAGCAARAHLDTYALSLPYLCVQFSS